MLVPTDAETLDPRYATDAVALRTTRLIHAGLVRLDPDTLEPKPYAAKSWQWIDDRALRVELRDDVRFHSGAPLVAEDVCQTIKAFTSKEVGSRHGRVVDAIGDCHPDGERTIVLRLSRAHATLLTDLELPILRASEAFKTNIALDGLGPFVVARREPGAIVLAPAEHSVGPKPVHGVTLRTVHDENARALRMHAGRADLVVNGFSHTLLPALEEARGVTVTSRPGANLTYLLANNARAPSSDARLRKALSLAIDRERIAKTLLAGHAVAANELLPPSHWAYTRLDPIPFDREAARQLLAEAGLTSVHVTLLTSTDRLRGTIARTLAQELAKVGIVLDVVPLELGTMIARLAAGDFELATLQMPELTEPNVLKIFLHSSAVPPAGANRGRVRDAEVDRLLDEGASSIDPNARKATYAKLEETVRAGAFFIPLWHEDQVTVASERAKAFAPSAEGRWLGLTTLR